MYSQPCLSSNKEQPAFLPNDIYETIAAAAGDHGQINPLVPRAKK